ncbi:MAG: 6-phosphogluconolactonase, partial [Armatimonadota bacterium]|nr:6-phosphogluconolactonase [Armatimonadota bacterium]
DYYADTLRQFFQIPIGASPPQFDLILLGLGRDGHAVSLFPASPSLDVTDRWVVSNPPGTLPPPVDRITMTFPVLNAARSVAFLVSGEDKNEIVQAVLEGNAPRDVYPAVGVQPERGELTWLLDKAAAGLLTRREGGA